MFKGQFTYNLDSKGRVSIPAKLRKFVPTEANDTFVMTRGINNCIDLYTLDQWQIIEKRLENLNSFDQKEQYFLRMILQYATDDTMDSQSRILIPQSLLNHAKIEKEVLVLGALKKIELWSPKVYEDYINSVAESYEQIASEVMLGK